MTNRSYRQLCPIACSLDVIGDRWTLLIVRELSFGQRRFSDLQRALVGIPSNLLANRLKEMEKAELISQEKLPAPLSIQVYALTARGAELQPVLDALTVFGLPYLSEISMGENHVSLAAAMTAMRYAFKPDAAGNLKMRVNFEVEKDSLHADILRREFDVGYGISQGKPELGIKIDDETLMQLTSPRFNVNKALQAGSVEIEEGDTDTLNKFLGVFH